MKRSEFFSIIIILIFLACNYGEKKEPVKISTAEEISASIEDAKTNTKFFSGKFLKIEKINERDYTLFLLSKNDSVISFITMMPLSGTEINLLKKGDNNIELNYQEYYNPVKKKTDRIVKYLRPIYDLNKK